MPAYFVKLSRKAEKGLAKLPPALRTKAAEFIDSFLTTTPLRPIPGKTKRLRGKLKGTFQYDLSDAYRIWWRVDQAELIVYVTYIGPHPKDTD